MYCTIRVFLSGSSVIIVFIMLIKLLFVIIKKSLVMIVCSLKLLPWLFIYCMYVSKACIKIVLPWFCTGGWRLFCGGSEDWQERVDVGNSHLCLVFIWALGKILLLETFSQWEALFSCMSDDSCNCTIVPSWRLSLSLELTCPSE